MFYYYVLLRHNGSNTYSLRHTHKHANTSTRKAQKDLKNSNQQSYQQTDETAAAGRRSGR